MFFVEQLPYSCVCVCVPEPASLGSPPWRVAEFYRIRSVSQLPSNLRRLANFKALKRQVRYYEA